MSPFWHGNRPWPDSYELAAGPTRWASCCWSHADCDGHRHLQRAQHLAPVHGQKPRARHRRQLIGLLLNDFEENASDWLWKPTPTAVSRTCLIAYTVFGRSANDALMGQRLLELIAQSLDRVPQDEHQAYADLYLRFSSAAPFRETRFPVVLDAETRWWSLTAKPLTDAHHTPTGWRGRHGCHLLPRCPARGPANGPFRRALPGCCPTRNHFPRVAQSRREPPAADSSPGAPCYMPRPRQLQGHQRLLWPPALATACCASSLSDCSAEPARTDGSSITGRRIRHHSVGQVTGGMQRNSPPSSRHCPILRGRRHSRQDRHQCRHRHIGPKDGQSNQLPKMPTLPSMPQVRRQRAVPGFSTMRWTPAPAAVCFSNTNCVAPSNATSFTLPISRSFNRYGAHLRLRGLARWRHPAWG